MGGHHPDRRTADPTSLSAMTDQERLAGYVAGGEPMDKAGAYALQGQGAALVESVDGDPTTVIGLPLHATVAALTRVGLPPPAFGA